MIYLKKYKWTLIFISFAWMVTTTAFGGVDHSGYKFSLYGGIQKTKVRPTSFMLAGNELEELVPNNERNYHFVSGFGIARRFMMTNDKKIFHYTHDISLGLDILFSEVNQTGTVNDYTETNSFTYYLKVRSLSLIGNVEWTFLPVTKNKIYPFIQAGAGLVSNSNYYYDEPNPGVSTGVGLKFRKYTVTQFAYDIGAGFKYMLSDNAELSLRYLYSNFSSARSGIGANLNVDTSYRIPLRTQTLLLGLSYLLDK